jgi:hypothetical protein
LSEARVHDLHHALHDCHADLVNSTDAFANATVPTYANRKSENEATTPARKGQTKSSIQTPPLCLKPSVNHAQFLRPSFAAGVEPRRSNKAINMLAHPKGDRDPSRPNTYLTYVANRTPVFEVSLQRWSYNSSLHTFLAAERCHIETWTAVICHVWSGEVRAAGRIIVSKGPVFVRSMCRSGYCPTADCTGP